MFAHRKQRTNTLLQDVGRAASRLAEESKSLAEVARNEFGDVGREVRDQASGKASKARRAAAARLAGAAEAVEPPRPKRRRRLPVLLSAIVGGVAAVILAKKRSRTAQSGPDRTGQPDPLAETVPASKRQATPAVTDTVPGSTATGSGPAGSTATPDSSAQQRAGSTTGNRSSS